MNRTHEVRGSIPLGSTNFEGLVDTSKVDTKNLDIYGSQPIPWARAIAELEAVTNRPIDVRPPTSYWLATTRPDGGPHVAAVGALWRLGPVVMLCRFFIASPAIARAKRSKTGLSCH